jgi:hypothetical protein
MPHSLALHTSELRYTIPTHPNNSDPPRFPQSHSVLTVIKSACARFKPIDTYTTNYNTQIQAPPTTTLVEPKNAHFRFDSSGWKVDTLARM